MIEIDDFFPINHHGKPLCAYSSENKLWVPLLEKAYLKSQGGYNFKGSNSDTDIYTFTSWMPELVQFKHTDVAKLWKRIYSGMKYRNCLISIGTGEIANEDQVGLCSGHAYGVLTTVECNGIKMLLVKNPWGKFVWKGKYSKESPLWNPELKAACNYKGTYEQKGVFWIDFESMVQYFTTMSLNWNPGLLKYKMQDVHCWEHKDYSLNDEVDATNNPQYMVRFTPGDEKMEDVICWLIFSSLEKEDESDDGYHALHVYISDNCRQMTILENPYIKGVYSNRKCDLTYLQFNINELLQTGTIIKLMIAEIEKKLNMNYM